MWRDDVWRGIQQIWIERFFFISILISSVFTFYFLIRWESNWNQFECIVAVGMLNVPTKAKQGREDKKCILLNLFSVFFQILNWNLYFPIISINFFHPFYFRDQQSFLHSPVRILWKWKISPMLKGIPILLVCECWWTRLHIGHRSYLGKLFQQTLHFMTRLYHLRWAVRKESASKWPPNRTEWEGIWYSPFIPVKTLYLSVVMASLPWLHKNSLSKNSWKYNNYDKSHLITVKYNCRTFILLHFITNLRHAGGGREYQPIPRLVWCTKAEMRWDDGKKKWIWN